MHIFKSANDLLKSAADFSMFSSTLAQKMPSKIAHLA